MSYARPQETHWQPASFLERGVAVPFTTPVLVGARARPAARFVELIVPHPAGVRGVYIMAWSELGNFCAPSLHDQLLCERIAGLATVTPRSVREAARMVAAEGAAGRAAQLSAQARIAAGQQALQAASTALLKALIRQTSPAAPAASVGAELQLQGRSAIQALAPRLGLSPARITTDLELLAEVFAETGLPPALPGALPALLADLDALAKEVAGFAGREGQAGIAARLIRSGAAASCALATPALAEAHAQLQDMAGLLARMGADPSATLAKLARAEWLLDGWDLALALWRLAQDDSQRATLCEMAQMVPLIPREAEGWAGAPRDEAERLALRGQIQRFEEWRTPALQITLTERNERARALAA